MRKLDFLYHRHTANPGDMTASPVHYFDWPSVADVTARGVLDPVPAAPVEHLIVGGGGLIGNDHFDAALAAQLGLAGGRRVLWGAGHNRHLYPYGFKASAYGWERVRGEMRGWLVRRGWRARSDWSRRLVYSPTEADRARLDRFDLVGLRDWDVGARWVPCASCLHPALDRHRDDPPRHELVFADHPKFFAIEAGRAPKLSNLENDIDTLVAFIASGRSVVTSSYHVAYWGVLLGRRVVVAPWSTKFLRFKWPVELAADLDGLSHHLARARAYPEALAEARAANLAFAADVAGLLGVPAPARRMSPS
jgi:hypothetical protein